MKKNLQTLLFLGILASIIFAGCKSSSHCAAYQDSRIDTHKAIIQHQSRG